MTTQLKKEPSSQPSSSPVREALSDAVTGVCTEGHGGRYGWFTEVPRIQPAVSSNSRTRVAYRSENGNYRNDNQGLGCVL